MLEQSIEMSWNAIEAITASMRHAAGTQNWFEVLELAASRHQHLLTHFDNHPVSPANANFYRTYLDVLLKGELELQTLVREARKSLMSEGSAIYQQQRAVGAYLSGSMS